MSPEQARGKAADRRADIWAFGVVLYEMVSGRRLFESGTVSDTLAAVLMKEPQLDAAPARLQPLLRCCLEKDLKRRLHDIADARLWLDDDVRDTASTTAARTTNSRAATKWLAALAVTAIVVGLGGWYLRSTQSTQLEVTRLAIALDAPLTVEGGGVLALSPDGRHVAFVATSAGRAQLYLRVQLHNRLECLLEEAHIKVSSLVSDLLGASARRMLQALADGETNPATLAGLASRRLHATPDQLCDALGACADLHPVYRRILALTLDELRLIDDHITQLDQEMANLLRQHQPAVQRLAEVPGLGVDSAQQIIAEVGPTAATFPSPKHLSSWVGACPGEDESAEVNYSHRSPKGNRQMRRVLNQAANAAVKTKGSIFELVYRRLVPRLGHAQAIGAIAHRLCRLIWKILQQGITYEERGPAVAEHRAHRRAAKMIRELRSLGYRVELVPPPAGSAA